jgi:hypothetical protein
MAGQCGKAVLSKFLIWPRYMPTHIEMAICRGDMLPHTAKAICRGDMLPHTAKAICRGDMLPHTAKAICRADILHINHQALVLITRSYHKSISPDKKILDNNNFGRIHDFNLFKQELKFIFQSYRNVELIYQDLQTIL